MRQRLLPFALLLLSVIINVQSVMEEHTKTHSLVKRTTGAFDIGKTMMTILNNLRTVIFFRLIGINTLIVAINTVGLLSLALIYELYNSGSTNRVKALEEVFGFQAVVGLITRIFIFYISALISLSFFIMITGFQDPEFENVDPIDFILNDMFGFALSFKGVHPNVRRLMVVAVLQIIGWSFLAKIGTIRKNIGSNQRQRKKRALASQSEDPLINLFSSVNPYFILESISKFD